MDPNFKEVNAVLLAYAVIMPTIAEFILETGHEHIRLQGERDIISLYEQTGSRADIVSMDVMLSKEQMFIFIVEAKRLSLGQGMIQCLAAVKDGWYLNGGGIVYGFVTTGKYWQMLVYDSTLQITEEMSVLFPSIGKNRVR